MAHPIIFSSIHFSGWSLGEHGEWSKYSVFDIATRVPLLISAPGLTTNPQASHKTKPANQNTAHHDTLTNQKEGKELTGPVYKKASAYRTDAMVELVDLFPTLSELAGLTVPPTCKAGESTIQTLCTEGLSATPLIYNLTSHNITRWKYATYSQYPRPSIHPQKNSDQPKLADIRYMGYSMRTKHYRFTEWVGYDPVTFTADWRNVVAGELYNHVTDPREDHNLYNNTQYRDVQERLAGELRLGWRHAMPSSFYTAMSSGGSSSMFHSWVNE